jgi:hypothetical protein
LSGTLYCDIIISEINSSPKKGETEWVEIHNTSSLPTNINELSLSNGSKEIVLSHGSLQLDGYEYLVVVAHSVLFFNRFSANVRVIEPDIWLTIYNDEGELILTSNDSLLDSIHYDNSWFGSLDNRAIYRVENSIGVDSSSWSVTDMATPGFSPKKMNSTKELFSATPFPFTPDGDGVDDVLRIKASSDNNEKIHIVIITLDGRVQREWYGQSTIDINWNGKNESGGVVPKGPFYIISVIGSRESRIRGLLWRN